MVILVNNRIVHWLPTAYFDNKASNTFQYVLKYRGRYENEVDYENLVIKSLPDGDVLRLKDGDLVFEDCDIIHCQYEGNMGGAAISIHQADGGHVHDIHYKNISAFLSV